MPERYHEAFEEWAIMTVDGNVDDITALKYIQSKYGRETAVMIWRKYGKKEN